MVLVLNHFKSDFKTTLGRQRRDSIYINAELYNNTRVTHWNTASGGGLPAHLSTSTTCHFQHRGVRDSHKVIEKHQHDAFSFAFNYYEAVDYFMVRGEKIRGFIIEPAY